MPSSSRGSALTILVTKLTHNRQPGQVKEMKKMKKAQVMTEGRYTKNRLAGVECEENMCC